MTDNEIIKALECCSSEFINACDSCPFKERCDNEECLELYTIDLINRQKAEIERLNRDYSTAIETMSNSIRTSRTEAVKEFAERLKKESFNGMNVVIPEEVVLIDDIDNLVKEMVGERR